MWNLIASNRILDLRWKKENQKKHLSNLRSIKSQLNNSAPRKYSFINSKPKTRQLEYQRQYEIQSHNQMLVQRMLNTTSQLTKLDKVFFKDSLNSTFTKKQDQEIDDNNQQLVKRLQSASSQYSKKHLQRSMRKYEKVKTNMASERMDPFYDLDSAQLAKVNKNQASRSRPYSARH